jgi:glutathione peroxidase
MRTTLLLFAVALVACDGKDAAGTDTKKTAQAPAKAAPADAKASGEAAPTATKPSEPAAAKPTEPAATPTEPAAMPTAPTDTTATSATAAASGPVLDHTVKLLDGSDKSLADYRGKALLVVNTASECGFTPQYADLQEVYAKYKDRGLEVLAFPSNDFGAQEPGTPEEIRAFVDKKFNVEFEMFDKVVIKGDEKSPLYKTLTEETAEGIKGDVKWNFTKFLVDPQGHVVQRFESPVSPTDPQVTAAIEKVLPKA